MSGVRDPAFWKRFSVAVHMDEEQPAAGRQQRADLKDPDSWLARQHRKKSRRTWVCCIFWLLFVALVAGVIIVVIWVLQSGVLERVQIGNGQGTGDAPPSSNSGGSTISLGRR